MVTRNTLVARNDFRIYCLPTSVAYMGGIVESIYHNTITKENYLLDLTSKSLKRKIQLIPYSEKEQDWAKSATNQNIEYKFGNEFDGEPLNLLCSRITGSGNFFMSVFPLNHNVD